MRIHDITVEADLSRSDPNNPEPEEPEVMDGTGYNAQVNQEQENFAIDFFELMIAAWELVNWWPRLFLSFSQTIVSIFDIVVSFDLLGDVQVHSFSVISEAEQSCTEFQISDAMSQYDLSFENLVKLGALATMELTLMVTLRALRTAACGMIWYGLAVGAWFALFLGWIVLLDHLLETGINHAIENAFMLGAFMYYLFPSSIALIQNGFGIIGNTLWLSLNTGLLENLDQWLGWRNWLLGIIEFVALLILSYYFAKCLTICVYIILGWI